MILVDCLDVWGSIVLLGNLRCISVWVIGVKVGFEVRWGGRVILGVRCVYVKVFFISFIDERDLVIGCGEWDGRGVIN